VKIAIITLSREGARIAARLAQEMPGAEIFVHVKAMRRKNASSFESIVALTKQVFSHYEGLIYIAPCGIVVRAIAPVIKHKTIDPAVVVIDAGGRYAVSLLSGHEGGANDLAFRSANIIGAEPIVSTTTEAAKTLIVGIGCRRGAESKAIVAAIRQGLRKVQAKVSQVRILASADIKKDEKGLIAAAEELGLSLRFVPSDEIISTTKKFNHSKFVVSKVNLPAVAEPSALLAGRRTRLILPKSIIHGVTVAIARECCM
jgi:cobalt-precorrin 5A hydrolase